IIEKYLNSLEDSFGTYSYDYTIHAHLHLPDQVRQHGPLYSHSQFVFEGGIYNLKKKMHGTKGFLNQLINEINNQMFFKKNLNPENFKSEELYSFSFKNSNNNKFDHFDSDQLLPPLKQEILTNDDQILFNDYFETNPVPLIICSSRLYFEKKVFHSLSYNRKKNSNSYVVCFIENGKEKYGNIDYFFNFQKDKFCFINVFQNQVLAKNLFKNFPNYFSNVVKNHFDTFYAVYKLEALNYVRKIIPCKKIKAKCIEVNCEEYKFISKLPFEFEHD
ncbi:unnamed protein product, partial [Brachionus calyciflorus]